MLRHFEGHSLVKETNTFRKTTIWKWGRRDCSVRIHGVFPLATILLLYREVRQLYRHTQHPLNSMATAIYPLHGHSPPPDASISANISGYHHFRHSHPEVGHLLRSIRVCRVFRVILRM